MAELWVGSALSPDTYRLVEPRSSGGEGQLWRGTINVDGADIQVAVKVIHPSRMSEIEEWRTRWRRQAELLKSLDHPGLVKVRELFEGPLPHERGAADATTNSLYLVMNWVDGPNLEEWVSRNPDRTLVQSARVLGKLATAIDYLHSGAVTGNAVLHRDIKPANVIISNRGPVLVDFGFTRVLSNQPMTVVGTPSYMAPELLTGADPATASDRYSLGATAYFALTGRKPDMSDRPGMVASLEALPQVPAAKGFAENVLSMMDPDPSHRPSGILAWVQQLVAGTVSEPQTRVIEPTPVPSLSPKAQPFDVSATAVTPRGKRKALLIAAGLVLVLGGLAAAAALILGGKDSGKDKGTAGPVTAQNSEATADAKGSPTTEATTARSTTAPDTTTSASPTTTLPSSVQVPSVIGKSPDDAMALLEAVGLVGQIQKEEGPGPYDKVASAAPRTGLKVSPGAVVTLTVPIPPATMPDVTGSVLTTAKRTLESYGITVTVQEVLQEGTDQQVLDQNPKAGDAYTAAVTLTVSKQPAIVFLADVDPVEGSEGVGTAQVNGILYTRSVRIYTSADSPTRYVEYDLARKYIKLRGIVGPRDDVRSDSQFKIEIYADGTKILDQTLKLGQTAPIELDVTNVLRLRLQVTRLDGGGYIGFGDIQILGDPDTVPTTPG